MRTRKLSRADKQKEQLGVMILATLALVGAAVEFIANAIEIIQWFVSIISKR
jgi:hypothetical protein